MIERFKIDVLRRSYRWVAVITVYRSGVTTDDTLPMTDLYDCPAKAARAATTAVRKAIKAELRERGAQ